MSSAEQSVMEPVSIVSHKESCPQTLKPENTFVFVVLSAQETLENVSFAAAVSVLPSLAVSNAQHPSSLPCLENQHSAVSMPGASTHKYVAPTKASAPFLSQTELPYSHWGSRLGLPTQGKAWVGGLAERAPAVNVGVMKRGMLAAPVR